MKKLITAVICLFPSRISVLFLKLIGHKLSWNSKIGFSIILTNDLILEKDAKIGHFNIIKINKIDLKEKAYIGNFNLIKGPLELIFDKQGAVGNLNVISRAPKGIVYGDAILKLGELAKITGRHTLDLTRSITLGSFSTVAGAGSQLWTHGYIHAEKGRERIRVDGEIKIHNNVYIGSSCIINAGVEINSAITIGSNSTISKDLEESGMYVGQALRFIKKNIEDVRSSLNKVDKDNLVEEVYEK